MHGKQLLNSFDNYLKFNSQSLMRLHTYNFDEWPFRGQSFLINPYGNIMVFLSPKTNLKHSEINQFITTYLIMKSK